MNKIKGFKVNVVSVSIFSIIFSYRIKRLLIISHYFEDKRGRCEVLKFRWYQNLEFYEFTWYQNLDDKLIRECVTFKVDI